ncbi:MAG: hypothetical protein WAM05_03715 [Candidatus Binataceae bacterium]
MAFAKGDSRAPRESRVRMPRLGTRASLLRQMPGVVLIAVAIADSLRFADPDLWGHITFGRAVLVQGHLTLRDPYSYSAAGQLWLNHEWLSEVIDALTFNTLGAFGLKLMKLCLAAITILSIAIAEGESEAPELAQLSVLLLSAVAIAPGIQFRPQTFTFALFSILMLILARDTYHRRGGLWLAILMLVLWANLHGGFIVGIAALATYACASAACDWMHAEGLRRSARLGAIAIGAAAATLFTPYGIGTWIAVAHALHNPYTRIVIADWQPLLPFLANTDGQGTIALLYNCLPLGLMIALAIAVAISRDLEDLPILAVSAVMCAAAFVATRNVPIAIIAIASPLARHSAIAAARLGMFVKPGEASEAPHGTLMTQLLLTLVAFGLLVDTGFFSKRLTANEKYPAGAVAFMQSHKLHGNILDNFLWGEYLIWHMAPESKVFIDGRYDTVYPRGVLHAFMLFHFDQPGADAILSRWPHDYVMLPPVDLANRVIARHPEWRLVYRDRDTLLYARAGSAAAKIAVEPTEGVNPPTTFP